MTQEDWGTMDWLADADTADGLGLSLARMTVLAGKTSPAHVHPNCNEVVHVLSGKIDQRLGDRWTPCAAGDTITVLAGTVHQTRCTSDTSATLMIAYSEDRRIYQEVSP
jgi:quercetin dioxygenase-like cupin family protein